MADDLEFSGHWEGMDDVNATLRTLPVVMQRSIARKALRAGVKVIIAAMLRYAPVGKTGDTKRAIRIKKGKRRVNRVSMMASLTSKLFPHGTFYAGWVNYGHVFSRTRRPRFRKQKGVLGKFFRSLNPDFDPNKELRAGEKHIEGTHWFEKARDEGVPAAQIEVERVLKAEIEKAFGRQAVSE